MICATCGHNSVMHAWVDGCSRCLEPVEGGGVCGCLLTRGDEGFRESQVAQ